VKLGPWRVIPGTTRGRSRPFWMVGRDEGGGIRYILTSYNRTPRRWKIEQGARDHCALCIRLEREAEQAKRRAAQLAAQRGNAPRSWPFPVSAHEWEVA
jgi:hypothetical protein